jgi:hypothetical protein
MHLCIPTPFKLFVGANDHQAKQSYKTEHDPPIHKVVWKQTGMPQHRVTEGTQCLSVPNGSH